MSLDHSFQWPEAVTSVRTFYYVSTVSLFILRSFPALRKRFLAYGFRATTDKEAKTSSPPQQSALSRVLDSAAALQVPHSYFTQFYILSVACSLFWGVRLHIWKAPGQLQIVWTLMLLQGTRRCIESYLYTSGSKSTMWIAHWILGLGYYVATNMAIWIDGLDAPPNIFFIGILVPAILASHLGQHSYHAYLYRLRSQNKGYQIPSYPLFPNVLCLHYTFEIAIYLFMTFLAAPAGQLVNWTMVSCLFFVVSNLGLTADGTRAWYISRFGAEKIALKKRMLPGIW